MPSSQLDLFNKEEFNENKDDNARQCACCLEIKNEEFFPANYRTLSGTLRRMSTCKECAKKQKRQVAKLRRDFPPPAPGTKCAVPNCTMDATHLDHDHDTGLIRGYICMKHNSALGFCEDDPANVMNLWHYITKYKQ